MKRAFRACRTETILGIVAIAIATATTPASAQPVIAPTTRSYLTHHPVPFDQARKAAEAATRPAASITAATAATVAPEIVELARALKNDPDLIYQYVHDNIEFSPLWGLLKGPVGTLLDRRGDSFDQAALMVALLNQASLSNPSITGVAYEFGELDLTPAQVQSWFGVDSDAASIGGILGSGGIPGSVFTNGAATVGHVWVKVNINGTAFIFDPAFKAHTFKTGITANLAGIMGYTQTQLVNDAAATVTGTSIQNVNRDAIRDDLSVYAGKLATYIRTNLPNAGVKDIVGGGTIVPTALVNGQTVRQTANPHQSGAPTEWASIPNSYFATLSVTLPGATAQTFNSFEIYGRRLSIFFNSSFVPTLYLDGAPVISGSANTHGAQVGVLLSISVPWAAFADQSRTQFITAETNQSGGSGGYVVQTGWDQVGRGMVEKHRKLLRQAMNSGAAVNSELVLGESLATLGYMWLAQCAAQQRISDQLLGAATQYFYGGGIVGQSVGATVSSPYVDLPLNFINTPARVNGSDPQSANSTAAFLDGSGASSSFESTTLEQTQANVAGFTAASTIKILDIAIQNHDTIFDINNDDSAASHLAYTSTIRPQLVPNYDAGDLASIDNYVTQGFRVIAPLHGRVAIGNWNGVGFKTMLSSPGGGFSYGEIISGGLSGGFGGTNDPPGTSVPNTAGSMTPSSTSPTSPDGTGALGDPLDHTKGSFLYKHEDLMIGPSSFPYGLAFERAYDSAGQDSQGPLGAGWTHNFAISAVAGSDGFTGMGESSPLSAVSSIVSLYVSSDLVRGQALNGQANLAQFVLESVVNHWFTDQLTENVVYLNQGWASEEFTKMADGSYAPPPGSAAILDAPTGTFRYRTKSGVTINFNASGQIASWATAAGALVNFSYTGGALTSVSNTATGRQLTLTHSANRISSVSDGARTVSYTYTGTNLTTFTDALAQHTTYSYDTSGQQDTAGHLTQVFYPSHPTNAFVTNFYDSLGRVRQQSNANGSVTQTFFAGTRTEIDDPLGNRHVWYVDALGNILQDIKDYGPSPHLNITTLNTYGPQGNLLSTTMPEGDVITYTYDSLLNPLSITHSAKPGSPLAARVDSFSYVKPIASFPNFEALQSHTDPNHNITTYTYNSTTGLLVKTDQPSVSKPGDSAQTPENAFTYTAIGLPQTSQDPEGRVTRFDYDPTHADEISKVTVDFGRLNLVTQYGYNTHGDLDSVTDPNGKVTTSQYDTLRRLTQINAPVAGVVTTYTYFPDGMMKSVTRNAATPETIQFTYTLSDKPHTITDALGRTTTNTYDADDRPQTITEQVSATATRQRTYSYDALGRILAVSDTTAGGPGQAVETRAYSPNGRVLAFTDANSHSMTYTFDGLDRISQTTFPDTTKRKFQFDAVGNVLQVTTRSAQTIGYTYDALNRLATRNPQGETAGQVTYGYDFSGRLLQASDASSANPYRIAYDTAGRPISYTDQQGHNVTMGYDAAGNRTRLQWPANTNGTGAYFVTYQYDALNRMVEIDENGSAANPLAKYQWDSLSRLSSITYGDGTTDTYSQYDTVDNLGRLTHAFNGGQNVAFTYSWFMNHQRQSTTVDNPVFQYVPPTGATNYAAANVNNGYTSIGGAALTFDGNRNQTFDGFNTLIYDVENRLVGANNIAGAAQYFYDPLNRRKQKIVNGVTTQFLVVGDEEIADFTGTGVGIAQTLTVRGAVGLPVAFVTPAAGGQPEAIVYAHNDVLGSIVALTQPGQSGATPLTYSDYGVPGAPPSIAYGFAGYRYDAETGLYYTGARTYSPQLGRFLQTDPIGTAGGANQYAYVGNDPVNESDPFGLFSIGGFLRGVGGVFETIAGVTVAVGAGWTGVGAVGGGLVAAHGIDVTIAAFRGEDTFTSQGIQAVGVSKNAANVVDAGISIVGSLGTGIYTTATKVAAIRAANPALSEGLSTWEILRTWEAGSQALNTADFLRLGGAATTPLEKALLMEMGMAAQLTTTAWQGFWTSISLAGTGLTPLGDLGTSILSAAIAAYNAIACRK